MPDNRAKYIATVLQAVILGAVTYYGVKWLVDSMDPTKKNRLAAQKQVGTCLPDMHAGSRCKYWYLLSDNTYSRTAEEKTPKFGRKPRQAKSSLFLR